MTNPEPEPIPDGPAYKLGHDIELGELQTWCPICCRLHPMGKHDGVKWIDDLIDATLAWFSDIFGFDFGATQTRWWRYQTPLGPAATQARKDIGFEFHRYRGGPAMATWDYLGYRPPQTGHAWEPLTAPGVFDHPDDLEPMGRNHRGYTLDSLPISPSDGLSVRVERWLQPDPPERHRENRRLPMLLKDI